MGGPVKQIRLESKLSDESADKLAGTFLTDESYGLVVTEDADVYKPDGTILLKFRKNCIPSSQCSSAYPVFMKAAVPTDNRGLAAGPISPNKVHGNPIFKDDHRVSLLKRDGTVSKIYRATEVMSGIIGYFDRNTRFPYCRLTAFNINQPQLFAKAMPFIRTVDSVFAKEMPERYQAQLEIVKQTSKDFVISQTAFTTVTVNRNFRTAVHKDAGDLKEGFGVMTALRAGKFSGGYTCFPAFRVAVDMATGDVLMADVHEWHGNTPFIGKPGLYERLSCVFYYREHMKECGSAEEELERAKNLPSGKIAC